LRQYHLYQVRNVSNAEPVASLQTALSDFDGTLIGLFKGLLGLPNTDFFVLVLSTGNRIKLPENFEVVAQHDLSATLRPQHHQPFTQDGVYVFRFWTLPGDHVDEVVRLSGLAWETFETDFATEVKALFRQTNAETEETAVLITWYQDFSTWEESRYPAIDAVRYFSARAKLISRALPIATRLVL